jgi:hypothetical protein
MKQMILTPQMGKRLIAKALAAHDEIHRVLHKGTLAIVAGTTNGYVAEEVLAAVGQADDFDRKGFRRGLVVPPAFSEPTTPFPGDVIITDGKWQRGKTIFDVADQLVEGDVVLKGANAINLYSGRTAVYIGHPVAGTIGAILPILAGRRVQLIVPVGLEKRVEEDLVDLSVELSSPGVEGPRMIALPGRAFTEIDAVESLTGAQARLLAAGGVYGAEGCIWLGLEGDADQLSDATDLVVSLAGEEPCRP